MNAIYGNQTAPESVKQLDVPAGMAELSMAISAMEDHIGILSTRLQPVLLSYKGDVNKSANAPEPVRSELGSGLMIMAGRVYGVRRQVLEMLDALQV